MLVKQNTKQREKLPPNGIYLENLSTYNHVYNEVYIQFKPLPQYPSTGIEVSPVYKRRVPQRHEGREHLDDWTLKFRDHIQQQEGKFWLHCVLDQQERDC